MELRSVYNINHVYTLQDIQKMVDPGWSDILSRLVQDLESLGWNGHIAQVKEKFGGLRFYTGDVISKEINDRIYEAESESYDTCEFCGKPGKYRARAWIKTLCDECHVSR